MNTPSHKSDAHLDNKQSKSPPVNFEIARHLDNRESGSKQKRLLTFGA